jgi:drug/metabolite transporter superfamily protein YnfA
VDEFSPDCQVPVFFAAACFGGLAIVFGSYAIWSDYREHEGLEGRFVGILMLGIILIVLAFLSEKAGPTRRIAIIFRNVLVGLCAVSVFLATLLVLIGPLH